MILNLKDLNTYFCFHHLKIDFIHTCSQCNSWDLVVTWRPLTCGMPTIQCLLLKSTKNISNSYGRGPISIYMLGSGALLRSPSLHQTYETRVFAPRGIGTYLKWLSWWLLFTRVLPGRVPSQHWWYPNPVSRFGFFAPWSQSVTILTQVLH